MLLPISVVIPTMNRPASLRRTLQYMAEADSYPSQIIIIDQSKTEEILTENDNIIQEYKSFFPEIEKIFLDIPSSTKARNLGYDRAKYEIVVYSDDDIDVNSSTYMNIYNLMKDSSIAMIAGLNKDDMNFHPSFGSYILGMASYSKRHIGHVAPA